MSAAPTNPTANFIHELIDADIASGRWGLGRTRAVMTRFPPEPNGYLHIGHAKSICLNFGLAKQYAGKFNLRFDDTNPAKEEQEYVDSIKDDVRWLLSGFNAGSFDHGPHAGGLFFASDLFQLMYDFAEELVNKSKAYVCQLSPDDVAARRGTPSIPATSPFRDRPIAESLALLREMRGGKHPNGAMTLRAKIDLASPNFNLRDPILYRIVHEHHHNTADKWCIYPMYDYAHGFEDSFEGVTHSICTLEFENHRPLYDWLINSINEGRTADGTGPYGKTIHHPQQIEFAKLRPTYTLLSKRNLLKMVQDKVVSGWDDPRLPTVRGLRRRGYTPESIRALCEDVGVTKVESFIDIARMENALRDHLNKTAPRAVAVLRPLRVVIDNWPKDAAGKPVVEMLDFIINPEDPAAGKRQVPFTGELVIERDDFMEVPEKKFHRLSPGQEVRLRWAYFITCTSVEKDASGNIIAVHCTYDPATRGGDSPLGVDGLPTKKVKGTLHWLSAPHAIPAVARLFERLFTVEEPGARTGNFMDDFNPQSLETVNALVEPYLAAAKEGERFQFERLGYFCVDKDSSPGRLVFNRSVTLKDSWAKESAPAAGANAGGKTYSFGQTAHTLKLTKEKLAELLTTAGIHGVTERTPPMVTQEEFDRLRKLAAPPKKA